MTDYELIIILFTVMILILISVTILYQYNIADYKHRIDCLFYPNTNATGLYNYDCDKLYAN